MARLAGIMAAKKTSELVPLCHPLPLTSAKLDFAFEGADVLKIEASVRVFGRTGVEMEALTAVSVAALTVYDMCKAVDKSMTIERIRLEEKQGGQVGTVSAHRLTALRPLSINSRRFETSKTRGGYATFVPSVGPLVGAVLGPAKSL